MEEVNALSLRNRLGEILDRLNKNQEPIFVSRGRKIKAVLVTPAQFERRFLDWQTEDKKKKLLTAILQLRKKRRGSETSLSVLRAIRGYDL